MQKSLLTLNDIASVNIRRTEPRDADLPAYDNTKLQALNTCPTWGVVRYSLHKTMSEHRGRNMPLEMGQVAHEVFAAVRLWQLRTYQHVDSAIIQRQGIRLFGEDRFQQALDSVQPTHDDREAALAFCLSVLESSSFYDDPMDRRRTMTNLEEGLIAYIDKWNWHRQPVWVRDATDFDTDVGIELPIDVVLEYTLVDAEPFAIRFVGRCDGLHVKGSELVLHENKTASRLDEAWRMSFVMSSQITGYMLALPISLGIVGETIEQAEVFGLCIPLPRTTEWSGVVREPLVRDSHHFERWLLWVAHTVAMDQYYIDKVHEAPRYTHSCNRYFRPCSLIPFCDSSTEEQQRMLQLMNSDIWSPLHEEGA